MLFLCGYYFRECAREIMEIQSNLVKFEVG